jgi:type IV secretion system protein VirB2
MNMLVLFGVGKYGMICATRKGTVMKQLFLAACLFLVILFGLFIATGISEAGTSTDMPWESPLNTISSSLTGPVAQSLCLIMVVVAVGVLIFGGDLSGWARSVTFMTLAAGILGGAPKFLGLIGITGAVI